MRSLLVLFTCFSFFTALQADDEWRMEYVPGVTVLQRISGISESMQTLPGLDLHTRANQELEVEIKARALPKGVSNDHLLLNLVFKRICVEIDLNGKKSVLDTDKIDPSLHMSHLRRILNKPLEILVDLNNPTATLDESLEKWAGHLPMVLTMLTKEFFHEWFQQIFALSGESLKSGKQVSRSLSTLANMNAEGNSLVYDVLTANYKDVQATYQLPISGNLMIQDGEILQEKAQVSSEGTMLGEAQWDRRNALLVQLAYSSTSQSMIKAGDQEWPMQSKVVVKVQSSTKEEWPVD